MVENRDAQRVFDTLCTMLDGIKWKYSADNEKLIVKTSAVGDDLPVNIVVFVDADRDIMYTKSKLPITVNQDKIVEMCIALHEANYSMLNGCFEYDIAGGNVYFKILVPFAGCLISEQVCHYMIMLTCQMVDKFNDKLEDLVNGKMTLKEFVAFARKD
ncbi:MAG: hypothetical protein ACI4QL_05315 [Candidatus Fimimonas sp.]